jgi:hypothetical protein
MPCVGFEPTIAVFERAKTVHALDCAVNVIDLFTITRYKTNQINIEFKICIFRLRDNIIFVDHLTTLYWLQNLSKLQENEMIINGKSGEGEGGEKVTMFI